MLTLSTYVKYFSCIERLIKRRKINRHLSVMLAPHNPTLRSLYLIINVWTIYDVIRQGTPIFIVVHIFMKLAPTILSVWSIKDIVRLVIPRVRHRSRREKGATTRCATWRRAVACKGWYDKVIRRWWGFNFFLYGGLFRSFIDLKLGSWNVLVHRAHRFFWAENENPCLAQLVF
jgi:hypothetical protein